MSARDPGSQTDENASTRPPSSRKVGLVVLLALALATFAGAWWFVTRPGGDSDKEAPPDLADEAQIPNVSADDVDADVYRLIQAERSSLALRPDQAPAWGQLGMAFYAHNLIGPALECFERAQELDPDVPQWPYLRGMIVAETDRSIGVRFIDQAAELAPEDNEIQSRLGEFYLDLQQYEASRQCFERVLQRQQGNPRAMVGLTRIALFDRRFDDALALAQQADRLAPGRHDINELLAQIQLRLGNLPEARRYNGLLEQLSPGVPWPDAILAQVYQLRVDTNKLSDDAARYLEQNRLEEFFRTLDRLIELEPEEAQWHVWLARTLLRGQNLSGAAQVLDRALTRLPNSPEIGFLRGVIHNNVGEFDQARQRLAHVLEIKSDYPEAHYHMAFSLRNLGEKSQAIESLQNVLRYEPNYAPAHLDLGALWLEQDELARAVEHLEKAVELSPQSEQAKLLLAEARARQGTDD